MKIPIRAASPEELIAKLSMLDIDVPLRSEGRTTEHVERYGLAYFLSSIPHEKLLFPLSVTHNDKPDFVIDCSSFSIGIEHIEAVSQNAAMSSFIRESGVGKGIYFIPHAAPGERVKKGKKLRQEIEADECGSGWVGDAPEREWAEAMLYFVNKKVPIVTATEFKRYEANWLLIYDNWQLPTVKPHVAANFLEDLLRRSKAFETFDSIFIISHEYLHEFSPKHLIHNINKPGA
ncbi:hypothetical protein [Pseudomonas sp. B28(2017)]|uniref:hypothetical protein n=1 Tax=Pseudomonas sp. B28(2017) TaxID=1981730 RepID=UPI00117B3FFC|nr:hypothetical protein [Pseudomonas sp. B28(2017)]